MQFQHPALPNLQLACLSSTLSVLTFWRPLMRSSFLLAMFISFFLVFQAGADQVTLKDGDRMTGTIVKSDGKTLVLHSDYAGDITLKFDAISAIQSDAQLHLELQDGKTVTGTVTTSDGKLAVTAKTAGAVEAPLSAVKNLRN